MVNNLSAESTQGINLLTALGILFADQKDGIMPDEGAAQRKKIVEAVKWAIDQVYKPNQPELKSVSAYENLRKTFERYNFLLEADGLLSWYEQTELSLPDVPIITITNAEAALRVAALQAIQKPEMEKYFADAEKEPLAEIDRANLKLMKEKWERETTMGPQFVKSFADAAAKSYEIWKDAKLTSDFAAWQPELEKVVALAQEKGRKIGQLQNHTAYEVWVGENNPALDSTTISTVFGDLKNRLPGLIKKVLAKQAAEPLPLKLPDIEDDEAITRICERVKSALGLKNTNSRVDRAPHPFSGGNWDDVRVTVRKGRKDILSVLVGLVHECGHAFYGNGLPREQMGQPVGRAQSMWVHETQSLFWERQVMMTPEFMEFITPILKQELAGVVDVNAPEWSPQNLYKLLTRVSPSFIRTEADELTYPIHVILRWELEQKLIDGSLAVKDLPAAWNQGMKEMLGIDVPDNKHGCMQDVHWAYGLFGDFPGYTFGAQGSAHLGEKIRQDIPEFKELVRTGNFGPLRSWLNENIHRHGSLYSGQELMFNATGKTFSADAWFKQMEERYLGRQQQQGSGEWQNKPIVQDRSGRSPDGV